jgi:NAD(P)H-hydrate repair Nnr-like enzyme with NAD(P)H-hydrate epimerase domain
MNRPYSAKDHLPGELYRAEQVRTLDRLAIEEQGIGGFELMSRAGEAAFAWSAGRMKNRSVCLPDRVITVAMPGYWRRWRACME